MLTKKVNSNLYINTIINKKKNKRKMTAPFHGSPARENMESPVKELGVKLPGIQHIKFMHRSECLAPKLVNVYIYSQRNSEVV